MSDHEHDPPHGQESTAREPIDSPESVDAAVREPKPATTTQRRGRLTPPVWVWGLVGLWCILLAVVRWANVTGDHAIANILTLVFGFLAFSALMTWFSFLSGHHAALRWGGLAALVVSIATFCALFRVHHVSGELVPTFRLRHAAAPDELLRQPTARSTETVSLETTSPDDFPEFLGPRRGGRVDHVGLVPDWTASPPKQLWRQPIGAGWGGFSVVNGYAVTMEQRGEQELVTCYRVEDGELIWSHANEGRHATLMGGVGPRCTPTIDQGRVYAQGAFGTVLCLDGSNGMEIWRDELLQRYGISRDDDVKAIAWGRSGSPLIVDDLVIVPAGGPKDGPYVSLIAFDKQTGDVVWESGDDQVGYSSPVLATLGGKRQVLIVNEATASGHDPKSGRQLWEVDWPGQSNANASASQVAPIPPNRFLLSKGYGSGAALFELSATAAGTFEVKDVWRVSAVLKTKFCNVVVHRDHVYGLSDGILQCVELATGKRVWKGARYGHGQILGVRDDLLVQQESGDVALVEATPDGFHERAQFEALQGKTWNNLALYGSRLLVRNGEEAACYELAIE